MKTDATMAEIWRVKDELGARSAWDPRAICADLIVKQGEPRADLPLVKDLSAALARHALRIARLPAPRAPEAYMEDDPTITEVRHIRQKLAEGREDSHLVLKDEPQHP